MPDNILYQYNLKPRKVHRATIFSGESTTFIESFVNRTIPKPKFSFSADDGFDQETKQHILNGITLEIFEIFMGQLSDLDYIGHLGGKEAAEESTWAI